MRMRSGTKATTQAMMMPSIVSDLRQDLTQLTVKSEVQKQRVQAKSLMGTTKDTIWSEAQLRRKLILTKGESAIFLRSRQKYFLPRGLKTSRLGKKMQRKQTVHTMKGVYSIGILTLLFSLISRPSRQRKSIRQNTSVKKPARFMIWKCVEQCEPYSRMFLKLILQAANPQTFQAMPQKQRMSRPTPLNMGKMQFMESMRWSSQASVMKLSTSSTTSEMKMTAPRPMYSPSRKQFFVEVNFVEKRVNYRSLPYWSLFRNTKEECSSFDAFQMCCKKTYSDQLSLVEDRQEAKEDFPSLALMLSSGLISSLIDPKLLFGLAQSDPSGVVLMGGGWQSFLKGRTQSLMTWVRHAQIFLLRAINCWRQSMLPQMIRMSSFISDRFSYISCSSRPDASFSAITSSNSSQRQIISSVLYLTNCCIFSLPSLRMLSMKATRSSKLVWVSSSRGRMVMCG